MAPRRLGLFARVVRAVKRTASQKALLVSRVLDDRPTPAAAPSKAKHRKRRAKSRKRAQQREPRTAPVVSKPAPTAVAVTPAVDRARKPRPANVNDARRSRPLTIGGVTKPMATWARDNGVGPRTMFSRLKRGWTPAQAVGMEPRTEPAAKVQEDGDSGEEEEPPPAAQLRLFDGAGEARGGFAELVGAQPPRPRPLCRMFTVGDRTLPLRDWADEAGVSLDALAKRLERGWDPARAVAAPRTRLPRMLTIGGDTRPLRAWAAEAGLKRSCVRARIDRLGWNPEKALSTPTAAADPEAGLWAFGRAQTVSGWAFEWGIPRSTLVYRLDRGKSLEEALGPKPPHIDHRTAWGRTQSVSAWAAEWVIPVAVLVDRLGRRGLSLEEALTGTAPVNKKRAGSQRGRLLTIGDETKLLRDWGAPIGVSADTLGKRLDNGWDPLEAVTAPKQVTNRSRDLRYGIRAGDPGSWSWYELPFDRDVYAQEFVTLHPDGASMDEVGAAMGIEVSWVCEMEQNALEKIRALVDDGEITEAELVAALDVFAEYAPPEQTVKQALAEAAAALPAGPMNEGELSDWLSTEGAAHAPAEAAEQPIERWQDVPDVPPDNDAFDEQESGVWPTSARSRAAG